MKPSFFSPQEACAYELGRQHAVAQFEKRLMALEQRLSGMEVQDTSTPAFKERLQDFQSGCSASQRK
jgi:hypothetical protein